MATNKNTETILSSDIYDISEFINEIQRNNSDLDDSTLSLGIFGYLNDMFTISTQNTVRMAAEYSNEAIATRAKYPKNVITHALNLGIKDIHATPATIKTLILVPEDYLLERLEDEKFTLDSNCKIYLSKVLKIFFIQPLCSPEITRIDNLLYILPIPFLKNYCCCCC